MKESERDQLRTRHLLRPDRNEVWCKSGKPPSHGMKVTKHVGAATCFNCKSKHKNLEGKA